MLRVPPESAKNAERWNKRIKSYYSSRMLCWFLHRQRGTRCWLGPACIVNGLSLRSTGGVSLFSTAINSKCQQKKEKRKKIQFISHSWSIQSHLFVGGLFVRLAAADGGSADLQPVFWQRSIAASSLRTGHISPLSYGDIKSAASWWGRWKRRRHKMSTTLSKENPSNFLKPVGM